MSLFQTDDGEGRKSRLTAWLYPGNDVTGMYTRSHRMVDTVSKVICYIYII